LGHRDTLPLLSQEALDQWHAEKLKLSILLFDEIDKSDALWKLSQGILDRGTVTFGDNRRVDFSRCIIVMTSNLGTSEMANLVRGRLGFFQMPDVLDDGFNDKIDRTAVEAARRKFSPEFIHEVSELQPYRQTKQLICTSLWMHRPTN
jgi:ATP-dependent Clp protease ATP-binding subunit ClpB